MTSESEPSPAIVSVLFDFNYISEDGRHIRMHRGERLVILKKTNNDWWQVRRLGSGDGRRLKDGKSLSLPDCADFPIERPAGSCNAASQTCVDCVGAEDGKSCDPSDKHSFYAPVSYLREVEANDEDITTSKDHKTTIKVGLSFTNALSTSLGLSDDALSEDDQLNGHSSRESLINSIGDDLMNGDESNTSIDCDKPNAHAHTHDNQSMTMCPTSTPAYANFNKLKNRSPPVPSSGASPVRILLNHWAEYQDQDGRKYYYNSLSRQCSWKPPRRKAFRDEDTATSHSEENLTDSSSCASFSTQNSRLSNTSPTSNDQKTKSRLKKLLKYNRKESEEKTTSNQRSMPEPLPKGWTRKYNAETRELFFVNDSTKQKWFCKLDENGRLYFFEENGQESYWELPELANSDQKETPQIVVSSMEDSGIAISGESNDSMSPNNTISNSKNKIAKLSPSSVERNIKSKSMAFLPTGASGPSIPAVLLQDQYNSEQEVNLPVLQPPPTSLDDSVKTLKKGVLNRTKLVENGKRIRKNWSTNYIALTDFYLLFFKDAKAAHSGGKPEMVIELTGAVLVWSPEKSSRKNCFQISTVTGQQILLQEDCPMTCKEWFDLIKSAIIKLPSPLQNDESDKETDKNGIKLKRSKSTKQYRRRDESADNDNFVPLMVSQSATNIPPERRKKIRERLRQFLRRRPTLDTLREKGIFKDEPVFGGKLDHLCQRDKRSVPKFVSECVKAIEEKDLRADGLYRACGNLSQVQRLRFQINQDDFSGIWAEDDVHVLTGLLKMFFRDMKDPLFPCDRFDALMKIIVLPDRKSKLEALKKLVKALPRQNHETLKFLLQHLLRVKEHSSENRMHIQNLAIVFGPTLMWPENDSNNFALDMMLRMHQNQIIEFLLLEYDNMFNG